jgi:hypothetical protein
MILLTNTVAQTIGVGETVTFDEIILHSGCGECHRPNTGSVKLRYNGVYELHFSANIGGETAATLVQLAISVADDPLPETTMTSVPAAVGDLNNVATSTLFKNCCGDYDRVTIRNTGTVPVVIGPNPSFYVKRVS